MFTCTEKANRKKSNLYLKIKKEKTIGLKIRRDGKMPLLKIVKWGCNHRIMWGIVRKWTITCRLWRIKAERTYISQWKLDKVLVVKIRRLRQRWRIRKDSSALWYRRNSPTSWQEEAHLITLTLFKLSDKVQTSVAQKPLLKVTVKHRRNWRNERSISPPCWATRAPRS